MNKTLLVMIAVMCAACAWTHEMLPSEAPPQAPRPLEEYAADAEQKEQLGDTGPARQQMETPTYEIRHEVFKSGFMCCSEKYDDTSDATPCPQSTTIPVEILGVLNIDHDTITILAKHKLLLTFSSRVINVNTGLVGEPEQFPAVTIVRSPQYDGMPITWDNKTGELIVKTTVKPPCSHGCKRGLKALSRCFCCCCCD